MLQIPLNTYLTPFLSLRNTSCRFFVYSFLKSQQSCQRAAFYFAGAFSLLAASCKSSVSTCSGGIWMYRTTLPLTKQFFNATSCGYFSGLMTLTLRSLTFRYWSTLWRVPVITTSFFSSTAISLPTSVLKNETNI